MFTYENIADYSTVVFFILFSISLSAVLLLAYHGAFNKIEVKCMRPPFAKDLLMVYKFTQNYTQSRDLLAEAEAIAPELDSFSIYHEDFYQRSKVGASVGVVLVENMQESIYLQLVRAGFRPAVLPTIDFAVVASFPHRSRCSLMLAIHRIYPALKRFIKANLLCAHPILELYTKDTLYFVAPLSKQFDFYAEEAIISPQDDSSSDEEEPTDFSRTKKNIDESYKCHSRKRVRCSVRHCDPLLESSSCERCRRTL